MPAVPEAAMGAPVVVKIGGSLIGAARLRGLLALLADAHVPLVIVPGGGPFADAVRSAQARLGLSDAACHAMALNAMTQTGLALADIHPSPDRLAVVSDIGMIERMLRQEFTVIWNPVPAAIAAEGLGRDWSVTSDSLAAWLALELGARQLVLLKSCAVPAAASASELAAAGIVDATFPRLVAQGILPWCALHHEDQRRLGEMLAGEAGRRSGMGVLGDET
jgi:aspartokinase-like uncharacterized kinase